jgi:hypothetical protein
MERGQKLATSGGGNQYAERKILVMKITSLKDLTPGQAVTIYNRQFGATNKAAYERGDTVGNLNRDIGYFRFIQPHWAGPEFAIWGYEIGSVYIISTQGKPSIRKAEKDWQTFRAQFANVCERAWGSFNKRDSIGAGVAYHIATSWGILCASIHDDLKYSTLRRSPHLASIFMRWLDYTGPLPFPLRDASEGGFARAPHKWNIHYSGDTMAQAREVALYELEQRLRKVPRLVPIADTYAEMITAVNRGDLAGAQQLAAQIAA